MRNAKLSDKPHRLSAAVAAFCMVMLLTSQAMPFSFSKGVVLEKDRIPLPGPSDQGAVWETRDLTVDYRCSVSGNRLRISGTVRLADSIRYSASILEDFRIGLVFVNGQGRALAMRGLATTGFPGPSEPMHFNSSISVPPDAEFMAFFYQGQASEGGNGTGSVFSFWEYPVH